MTPEWKSFLSQNGAEFEGETLTHFGNDERERRAALGGDIICDLSRYRLLAIQGGDARSFLQGQLTNDVDRVTDSTSQLTGFCTPKGRLIANFRILQNGSTLFAIIPAGIFNSTQEQLRSYVISADVQMGEVSDALVDFGVSGEQAETHLQAQLGDLPKNIDDVLQHERHMVIKIAEHRYQVFGNLEDCKSLWSNLDVHCTPVSGACWELLNIRDGIPEITSATADAFVPQMLNMDLLNGISFDKGCYTGQEIIARTHYLGKQKRRLYHLDIECDALPQPGDELKTASSGENQYIGTIINVQAASAGDVEALAVVQISSADDESLGLKGQESKVSLQEPPYGLQSVEV